MAKSMTIISQHLPASAMLTSHTMLDSFAIQWMLLTFEAVGAHVIYHYGSTLRLTSVKRRQLSVLQHRDMSLMITGLPATGSDTGMRMDHRDGTRKITMKRYFSSSFN